MRIFAQAGLLLLLLSKFFLPVSAQEGHIPPGLGGTFVGPWTVGLQVRYTPAYQSFLRENNAFPYRSGDMLCRGKFWSADALFHLERERFRHYLVSTYAFPAALRSPAVPAAGSAPNGIGSPAAPADLNPAALDPMAYDPLREPASAYQRLHVHYYFNLPLYREGRFRIWYGLSASVLYEKRNLRFVSGLYEEKWDVNAGFGPTLAAEVYLLRRLAIRTEGHLLFHAPYTSYGKTRGLVWENGTGMDNESGQIVARDGDYSNFFVGGLLDVRFRYFLTRQLHLHAGYRFVHQNGHAVLGPASDERLAFKLDRLHELFVGVHLNIPSTWRKRKPNPPCPLSG